MAQLLKLNGASRVVIAANKGIKTQVAQELECGDEYVEFDRVNPEAQWTQLKEDNPYGFDVVASLFVSGAHLSISNKQILTRSRLQDQKR